MDSVEREGLPDHRQSKLDIQTVRQAVSALLAHEKKFNQTRKKEILLNNVSTIHILLAVWKITGEKARTIKIKLPHTLRTETTDACLFTKDLAGKSSEECTDHFNDLLKEKNVAGVAEVIPFKCLKKEYMPFIARRQLATKYDIFLADERIFRLMHVYLGKEFYKKKKYPVCVCLTKQDLKKEIEDATSASYFILSHRGDCNHFNVGRTDMTADQVVENIMTGVQSMVENITKGWPNVKALYIKSDRSIALPIYTSLVYEDWADNIMVDNSDIVRLKKQIAEKPVTGEEQEQIPDVTINPKMAKRRLSGRALVKMKRKIKQEKEVAKATLRATPVIHATSLESITLKKKAGKLKKKSDKLKKKSDILKKKSDIPKKKSGKPTKMEAVVRVKSRVAAAKPALGTTRKTTVLSRVGPRKAWSKGKQRKIDGKGSAAGKIRTTEPSSN